MYYSVDLRGEYAAGDSLALKRRLINNVAADSKTSVVCNLVA
jgi:hypothetical protein